VRQHFPGLDADPALRHLDATDGRVHATVMDTPRVQGLVLATADTIAAFLDGTSAPSPSPSATRADGAAPPPSSSPRPARWRTGASPPASSTATSPSRSAGPRGQPGTVRDGPHRCPPPLGRHAREGSITPPGHRPAPRRHPRRPSAGRPGLRGRGPGGVLPVHRRRGRRGQGHLPALPVRVTCLDGPSSAASSMASGAGSSSARACTPSPYHPTGTEDPSQ
jgi:hypothetical protein